MEFAELSWNQIFFLEPFEDFSSMFETVFLMIKKLQNQIDLVVFPRSRIPSEIELLSQSLKMLPE